MQTHNRWTQWDPHHCHLSRISAVSSPKSSLCAICPADVVSRVKYPTDDLRKLNETGPVVRNEPTCPNTLQPCNNMTDAHKQTHVLKLVQFQWGVHRQCITDWKGLSHHRKLHQTNIRRFLLYSISDCPMNHPREKHTQYTYQRIFWHYSGGKFPHSHGNHHDSTKLPCLCEGVYLEWTVSRGKK